MSIYQKYCRISAKLDEERRWEFESSHASDISKIWTFLTEKQPKIFNGAVLMSHHTSGSELSLEVNLLRTSYAAFMAWRELNHPVKTAKLCFPIAAIKTSDEFFVLGTMASHTSNAGLSYFPSGTLNDDDVLEDGTVALEDSLIREVREETGLTSDDYELTAGWTRVENDVRCAFFKEARLRLSRAEASERIAQFLQSQIEPELSGMLFVRTSSDVEGLSLPVVQREYFSKVLDSR